MKAWPTVILILGLVLLDAVTKLVLSDHLTAHANGWVYTTSDAVSHHYRTREWKIEIAFAMLIPIFACIRIPRFRLTAAFILAGMLGNWISAVGIGYIPDPLLWEHGDTLTHFNVADLTLLMAFPALLVACVSLTRASLRSVGEVR
jgi:lipoprotein signal peptidase